MQPMPVNYRTIYIIEHSEGPDNPRRLPVPSSNDPLVKAIMDLSQWFSTNEDGYFNGGQL